MWFYRDFNIKGIKECFCNKCNNIFYLSAFGAQLDNNDDYMYQAYNKLIGHKKVKARTSTIINDNQYGWLYEKDNDYEMFDIMHLVQTENIRGQYNSTMKGVEMKHIYTFVKGKNYGKYDIHSGSSNCPYCGSDDFFWANIGYPWKDDILDNEMYKDRHFNYSDNQIKKKIKQFQEQEIKKYEPIKIEQSKIKDYLNNLLKCEINIRYFKERLIKLYYNYSTEFDKLRGEYIKGNADILLSKMSVFEEPLKPILKKASIFNKKKIEEENKMIQSKYEEEMLKHIESFENYKEKLNEYEIKKNKRENEYLDIIDHRNYDLLDMNNSTELKKFKIISQEVDECEDYLKEFIKYRKELHSFQVLYPKYLDFPIIATLYEYLISGRCEKLEGPDGAYNLYEFELRQNIIINKLDDILDSLEVIKENQYYIYNALNNVNSILKNMNNKMDNLLSSVDSIEKSVKANEYYSYKTSCYANIIADKTSTMEFLALYDFFDK